MFTANSSGTSRQTMFNKDTLYCKYAMQLPTGCCVLLTHIPLSCTHLARKARTNDHRRMPMHLYAIRLR